MTRTRSGCTARKRGFTLIELMVVVAIVAIIAAIAVPAYGRYAYRARRADGQELLLRIANAQERYYSTYNTYGDLKTIGYAGTTTANSEKQYYQATAAQGASGDWQSFVVTARAMEAQAKDACGDLSIDNTGMKKPPSTDASKNANGNCW